MKTIQQFASIKKRDGRVVQWDESRITFAILKAMQSTGEGDVNNDPQKITKQVVDAISKMKTSSLDIEVIQDVVEETLILLDFPKTAKAYILYRYKKQQERLQRSEIKISNKVARLASDSKKYFPNELSEFIYYSKYARWIENEQRRETWIETVNRYVNFMREILSVKLTDEEYDEIFNSILNMEVLPSMRLLWSAGDAARSNHITAYNCAFVAPTKIEHFAEIMFISMSGCGLGFSVESENTEQLPIVKKQSKEEIVIVHIIQDSKEGWCDALTIGLKTWWSGKDVVFDYSQIRPAGTRLKTMGGRASGPEPLRSLLTFTKNVILSRQRRHLRNIDVHDIICKIGDVVVSGGVRRSALISLSDFDDMEMRKAKIGTFYTQYPHRALANNSAVFEEKPTAVAFLSEWLSLAESGTGERGIFNREGAVKNIPSRRKKVIGKDVNHIGGNPCLEILLRHTGQFCNLSEVVCRIDDDVQSLKRKIRIATIIGTYQSSLTDFKYISSDWKKNCDEERLLGVSLTGQWDCPSVRDDATLVELKNYAIEVNKEYANKFGITPSTAITCTKPSGSVSKLVNSASGVHARFAKFYIQRVRLDAKDPLFAMLKEQNYPYVPDTGQDETNATRYVFAFPIKSPDGSITRHDVSAINQLDYWMKVKKNYAEHTVSCTVYVKDDEWIKVGNWVYENFDDITGVSFLPFDGGVYQLAPYEEINEEQYNKMVNELPKVDFSRILVYEQEDSTQGSKELACSSGSCEL